MSNFAISSILPGTAGVTPAAARAATQAASSKPRDPGKVHDAAQQFEALLMGQILRSARQSSGWLGTDADPSAECATDFAEQQFATVLSQQGGLGLADLIAKGLKQ